LKLKLSRLLKFAAGVYVTGAVQVPFGAQVMGPLVGLTTPWLGPLTTVKVKLGLSMSLAVSVMVTGVSSLVVTATLLAVGGSFTGFTVMLTVAVLLAAIPSLALNVKLSGPL